MNRREWLERRIDQALYRSQNAMYWGERDKWLKSADWWAKELSRRTRWHEKEPACVKESR